MLFFIKRLLIHPLTVFIIIICFSIGCFFFLWLSSFQILCIVLADFIYSWQIHAKHNFRCVQSSNLIDILLFICLQELPMLCGEELGPTNRKTYILNLSIFEENSNIPGSSFVLLPKVRKIIIKNWKKFVCCVWRRHFLMDTLSRNCTKNQRFEWDKNISDSLLIHRVNHDRGGVWISDQLISLDFLRYFSPFYFDWQDISNTQDSVWPQTDLEVHIYDSLRGVWR